MVVLSNVSNYFTWCDWHLPLQDFSLGPQLLLLATDQYFLCWWVSQCGRIRAYTSREWWLWCCTFSILLKEEKYYFIRNMTFLHVIHYHLNFQSEVSFPWVQFLYYSFVWLVIIMSWRSVLWFQSERVAFSPTACGKNQLELVTMCVTMLIACSPTPIAFIMGMLSITVFSVQDLIFLQTEKL